MGTNNDNINYTADDIKRYFSGDLSPRQMHAMEKAALDDPFLAEAIEGYQENLNKPWAHDLVVLRKQITEKGAGAKVIPLHKRKNNWWKTAAAIFIAGSGLVLTFVLTRNEPDNTTKPQIAQTIVSSASDSVSANDEVVPENRTISLNPTASTSKEQIEQAKAPFSQKDKSGVTDDKSGAEQALALRESSSGQNGITFIPEKTKPGVVAPSPPNNTIIAEDKNARAAEELTLSNNSPADTKTKDAEALARKKSQVSSSYKKEAAINNYFTAQVVAPDNSPLPFTNISIKKDNFGTYADAKGMVRLVSADSVLVVEVNSVGYLSKTFMLRNNQAQTKIILQEDELALNDKMVIGNASVNNNRKSRRATLVSDSAVNVEPADGWENYNTYVANNLDIPESSLRSDFHGEVELSFDVRENGTISNIRVNKSLGAELDEAAKRILLEGPQWKVKKGKKTSANVRLQF